MANIEFSKFQGQIGSAHKELGSNAVVLEILEQKGTSITIYGAENSNADEDDLQVIGHIISYMIQEEAGASGVNRFGTFSDDETKQDKLVITSSADVVYHIWVLGRPGKA